MNPFAVLASEVASSEVVARHGDVPEVKVKVHHPPRRSDGKGWTTVQSGRKHKGGKTVSQAGAKPASKKPDAGKNDAGKTDAGKTDAGDSSARKNKGVQNAAQAGAKPARVPVTLGAFFDGAKYCTWKKPVVAAVVAETSRPALVASWPTPQEACDAKVDAKTATTSEVAVAVVVETTATAANKKRRNKKKRQLQQQQLQKQQNPSASPVLSTEAPVAEPASSQVQDAEPASLGVEAELKEQIRSLREALAAREEEIDSLSKQLDSALSLAASLRAEINSPDNNGAIEDAGCGTPVAAATVSPLKRASSPPDNDNESIEDAEINSPDNNGAIEDAGCGTPVAAATVSPLKRASSPPDSDSDNESIEDADSTLPWWQQPVVAFEYESANIRAARKRRYAKEQIMDMGFSCRTAERALRKANYDVEAALDLLLTGAVKDEVDETTRPKTLVKTLVNNGPSVKDGGEETSRPKTLVTNNGPSGRWSIALRRR